MTETGLSLGTPQYMSPEEATAERELDARSDVYAVGAVTYEMLTGEPPFTGATTQAIVAKLLTEVPRRVSILRKSVPPHVEAAVLTSLEKLPADRFSSAGAFSAALRGEGSPTVGLLPGRRDRRWSRVLLVIGSGMAALLAFYLLAERGCRNATARGEIHECR